jgi:hypothetical protein
VKKSEPEFKKIICNPEWREDPKSKARKEAAEALREIKAARRENRRIETEN